MRHKPFEQGNTFSRGRPKGARNKLASRVLQDLLSVWDEPAADGSKITRGISALRTLSRSHPNEFAKLFANIVPREFWIENGIADMADDELDKAIDKLRDEIRAEQGKHVVN